MDIKEIEARAEAAGYSRVIVEPFEGSNKIGIAMIKDNIGHGVLYEGSEIPPDFIEHFDEWFARRLNKGKSLVRHGYQVSQEGNGGFTVRVLHPHLSDHMRTVANPATSDELLAFLKQVHEDYDNTGAAKHG